MKRNLGTTDKVIRILVAVVIAILFFTNQITATAAVVLLIIGGILALTSILNFCPLYLMLGISTGKKEK